MPKFTPVNIRHREFIELDDRNDRTTESYKKYEDYYDRKYAHGSVLTVYEFLSQLIPGFEELLKNTKLDGYVSKISEQTSQLVPPHGKVYKKLVE